MPDKLTDKEIVKALECHIKRQCWNDCPNATEERQLLNKPCSQMIAENALDLINRLQEDKQNLEIELKAMRGAANSYKSKFL